MNTFSLIRWNNFVVLEKHPSKCQISVSIYTVLLLIFKNYIIKTTFTKIFWTLHFWFWCIPFAFSPLSSERDLTWKHLWILGEGSAFSLLLVIQSPLWFFLLDPSTFVAFCMLQKSKTWKGAFWEWENWILIKRMVCSREQPYNSVCLQQNAPALQCCGHRWTHKEHRLQWR